MPDPATISRPWIAAYPPGVPPTYRYPAVPLTRFLDDAARDFPDVVATTFQGARIDYAALRDLADRFAGALASLGLRQGDHVATALPNLPAAVVTAFAAWRLGAVVVPIDPTFPEDEQIRQLRDTEADLLVCLTADVPRINRHRGQLPRLRHVVATGPQEWLRPLQRVLAPLRGRRAGWYRRVSPDDDVLAFGDLVDGASRAPQAPLEPGDLAAILSTSGITGARRLVALSHANLVANAFQARLWVPDIQAGRERLLAVLPFYHAYGLTMGLLTGVLSAATLVLLARPDPGELLDTIERQRPTLLPAVPSIYAALAAHPEVGRHDLTSIRACVSGGAPLPPDVAAEFERVTGGARLREGYGLTEAGPLTHANPIYGRFEPGTIGLPVTDTVAIVVDPDDPTRVLPAGTPGELAIHGPQVMAGYWGERDETAATLRDGWLLTGDVAVHDEDGVFRIVDRRRDVLTVDGVGVYPREVEDVLLAHPGVLEATAIGVPRPEGGERLKAYVVLRPRSRATPAELLEHCREHLSAPRVPSEIELRDTLPQDPLGKVLRRHLRDEELSRLAQAEGA